MKLLLGALLFLLAINYAIDFMSYSENQENLQRELRLVKIQSFSRLNPKFDSITHRLDSVDLKLSRLARASIYLDSCQQARTARADRAERRGRFVGGLLRGLFPGL